MELTIYEQLMLLALDDDKGKVIFSASLTLPFGIAGAILFELENRNRIAISNNEIILNDHSMTGEHILDEALKLIAEHKHKPSQATYWIERLAQDADNIQKTIIQKLVKSEILKEKEGKILWLIPTHHFPTNNPVPEINIRLKIKSIVLDGKEPTRNDISLLSLIYACNLIEEIFTKDEMIQAQKIISSLIKSDKLGNALAAVLAQMTLAITAAINSSVIVANIT